MLRPDDGAPSGGSQPNNPSAPSTEGTGKTQGAQGGAGDNPAGGTPPQPQASGEQGQKSGDTPRIQWTPEQQTEIDRVVQARLAQEEDRKKKADAEEQRIKDEAKKLEQGSFKDVAEQRGKTIEQLQEELATERRERIALKHNLPAEVAARLVGTTVEELDKDAQALAKLLKAPVAPNTEAGKGNKPAGAGAGAGAGSGAAPAGNNAAGDVTAGKRYAFQEPGDVSWN